MKKNLRFAFIQTIPVLFGYLFLGIAFGLMLQRAGYNFIWAGFSSIFIYAGSMQFVLISMLGSNMDILSVILLTLSINSRHIFYGISFIQKFKAMGRRFPYMVFSLTDETYSLLCSAKIPPELDEKKVFFFIACLDHSYWITGGLIGAILGQLIHFNSTGVDFAMTALFVVIFVEHWLGSKSSEKRQSKFRLTELTERFRYFRLDLKDSRSAAILGLLCGVLALLLLGPDRFILMALLLTVGILCLSRFIQIQKAKERGFIK